MTRPTSDPLRGWERRLIHAALLSWPREARRQEADGVLDTVRSRRASGRRGVLPRWADTMLEAGDIVRAGVRMRWAERRAEGPFPFRSRHGAMTGVWTVLHHAARSVGRSPRWSVLVLAVLTVGIGATVSVFTVVDRVVLRPLPYDRPEQLVRIGGVREARPGLSTVSGPNFRDLAREATTLSSVAASTPSAMGLVMGEGQPELVRGGWVSGAFFTVLGVGPAQGRVLGPADDERGAPLAVVVSHAFARARFGQAEAVGHALRLEDRVGTVVGVMPPDFHPPEGAHLGGTEVWAPLSFAPLPVEERGVAFLDVVGRRTDGSTLERLVEELDVIGSGIAEAHALPPRAFGGFAARPLRDETLGGAGRTLSMLLAAVGLLLGVACLNVGTLVLLRTVDRAESLRVKVSLGATRARAVAEVMAESLVLSLLGGAGGTLGAVLAVDAVARSLPVDLPRLAEAGVDVRVALAALGISGLVGLVVGAVPAARIVGGADLGTGRGGRGRSASRGMNHARDGLILVQVALGLALTVGAGLLGRSLLALHAVDLGFDTSRLHVATLRIEGLGGPDVAPDLLDRLVARASVHPAVSGASLSSGSPYTPGGLVGYVQPEGADLPQEELARATIELHRASAGHLSHLGVPLRLGRYITPADGPEAEPVVVVSQSVADTYWPEQDPIGRRLVVGGDGSFALRTVVGVVASPRFRGPAERPEQHLWLPYPQWPLEPMDLVLRLHAGAPPADVVAADIASLDTRVTVRSVRSVEATLRDHYVEPTFFTALLSAFSLVALLLATVGMYGALAHSVRSRRREFGVRLALGADRGTLVRGVVTRGGVVTLLGIALGLVIAWFGTRLMDAFLFGTTPLDVVAWFGAGVTLLLAGLAASWVPARAAGATPPRDTLLSE